MRNIKSIILACLLAAGMPFFAKADSRAASFNDGWKFYLGDSQEFATPECNDSEWRALTLPHDWAIEGDFSQSNPSGTGGGALPGGIGWYRKTFDVPADWKGKDVYVDFDGAYMLSTVYVNGHELGSRPYGYAPFSYNIAPYLKYGQPNVIAVKVDNSEQPNSRWYSGCGIYRNTWLRVLEPVHVAQWGVYSVPTRNADGSWACPVEITIENSAKPQKVQVKTVLVAPDGVRVDSVASTVKADGKTIVNETFNVASPRLWDVTDPALYTLETTIYDAKKRVADIYSQTIGFRYFDFDPAKGFSLNGKPMKINGVCMHHDQGALGTAVNKRAIQRQLEILKEMGTNAYRCSHNPPAPEVLELCDQMGFLVMDETFDMWRKRKTSHDYSRYFDQWHERDLTDMMLRDRNHPSIIIWSIGNEVLEQWTDANADTLSLEEANMILNFGHSADMLAAEGEELSVNSLLTIKLADLTRQIDSTRPITAGCNEPSPGNHLFRSGALDIIGYNYHENNALEAPQLFPGQPFIFTESASSLHTRGFYHMPADSMVICPERWDKPYEDPTFSCSSYDNCRAPWGATHEDMLRVVKENDFVSGQFIWTGFDYIGEPTPYGWPARSSYFGVVDLAGIPKDSYYLYQSEWNPEATVLHLLPHWNWTEGEIIDVWCYYNNADEVELYLNGESQGVSSKTKDKLHASWKVAYVPGQLKAVSRKDGAVVAETIVNTAGKPYAVRLTPDRQRINADGKDLCYVTVEVVDENGNVCPLADNEINFVVDGAAFNAGVDNGSPISLERFKADKRKAFYGKAMLIVQNNGEEGIITVKANSDGLLPAMLQVIASE